MYYCDNLASYMGKLNNSQGMDLTLYKSVPKSLYIQVSNAGLALSRSPLYQIYLQNLKFT